MMIFNKSQLPVKIIIESLKSDDRKEINLDTCNHVYIADYNRSEFVVSWINISPERLLIKLGLLAENVYLGVVLDDDKHNYSVRQVI